MALILFPIAALSSQLTPAAQEEHLRRYTIPCNLGDNVSVVESSERAQPFVRSVNTTQGEKQIVVLHGYSQHIAYAGTPFVNFKAERLDTFDIAKQNLIQSLSYMAAGTQDMEPKPPRHSLLNGFDVYSIDRTKLSGGVQSVYLLFRDADRAVVTLYILNTPPEDPQFSTIEQYRALRDTFVTSYTGCVARALK